MRAMLKSLAQPLQRMSSEYMLKANLKKLLSEKPGMSSHIWSAQARDNTN